MATFYGTASLPVKFSASRSLLLLLNLSLLPGFMLAAEQERVIEQAPLAEEQQAINPDTAPGAIPPDTHATQQASDELLIMAVHQPENFIGKTLLLDDGANTITVGPVTDLRRRVQDQELYLIVDAKAYFNTAVEYAVAVKDVDRMEADRLIIPQAPGMHLRGLDYYPDDYTDIEKTAKFQQ